MRRVALCVVFAACGARSQLDVTADAAPDAGTTADDAAPAVTPPCATEVSAGGAFTCARAADGTAWCWGSNVYGELGDGASHTSGSSTPVQVLTLDNVADITAGSQHACAREVDGSVWCWGNNFVGQLGNGGPPGEGSVPVQVTSLGPVVQVSAGGAFTCAVTADGSLWCWGYGLFGQLGDGSKTSTATPRRVDSLGTNVAAVAAAALFACALDKNGFVWCWGDNTFGQLGDGTMTQRSEPARVNSLAGVVEISAQQFHACARKGDGTLWCWGHNATGALGDLTFTNRSTPVQAVTALSTSITGVSAGDDFTCAQRDNGSLWCWGINDHGELGNGMSISTNYAVAVYTLDHVTTVTAGSAHTCALRADGALWCWGMGGVGQLGDGTTTDHHLPSRVKMCP